ncbi:alpha-1B adrenergic receptor-like [Clarias gariepinus]|uniref:alpha-1B adrenergic receptor-like n=1 Tax=Clarias gariepinus TaxID=13013 RepID=UPI00234C2BE2|nr:alpha-1B adrenergic receptor-like [Clarias gariepinus]
MNANEWIMALVRACMCSFGVLGNTWLAFHFLPRSRSQLRTNNILFVNLAISNLITNYLVDLPETLDAVIQWIAARKFCTVLNFCSDVSESSSIFSTMFITVYWHQKLVGSLKRGGGAVQMDNLCLVTALLTGSWTFATIFSIPHLFFISKDIFNQSDENCVEEFPSQEAKLGYEMSYLALANLAPIIGIVFASIQIAVTLVQNEKRIRNSTNLFTRGGKVKTKKPPELTSRTKHPKAGNKVEEQVVEMSTDKSISSSGNQIRAAKSVVTVAMVFLICWLTHLALSITIIFYKSIILSEMISFIGATYTCIIPYMYLHGLKKLNCSCKG